MAPRQGTQPGSPSTGEWDRAMDARLRKYGSRAARVWGYIGIALLGIAVCWILGSIWDALSVLLAGALMAFIYAPIVNFLDRRFHLPRLLCTFIGLISFFVVIALLFAALLPPISEQCIALVNSIPQYVKDVQDTWDGLVSFFNALDPALRDQIGGALMDFAATVEQAAGTIASAIGGGLIKGVSGTVMGVVSVFMTVVVSFWLAKDFPRIEREIATIVGPRIGGDYRIVTSVFGRSLGGYLKGLVVTSLCTGLIAGVGFWILGVPYSGLLGLVTGVLNVIPYIGPWTGGALAFLVGLTVGWAPALLSVVVSVVAQQVTDMFVSPKVMQAAVALHPALVILALLAGGAVGGIVGMIMAVPLTAAIKGVFVYYFEKKTGRQLVRRDGAIFKGEQFCDESGNPRPACDALGVDIAGDVGVPPRIREAQGACEPVSKAPRGVSSAVSVPGSDEGPSDADR